MEENVIIQTEALIVGVGEAGCRAIVEISKHYSFPGLQLALAGTMRALGKIRLADAGRLLLDKEWSKGLDDLLGKTDFLAVMIGLGNESETQAVMAMAAAAQAKELPFIVFATLPFTKFSDEDAIRNASQAVESLKGLSNAIVVMPNDALFHALPPGLSAVDAYDQATCWLAEAVISIVRPFTAQNLANTSLDRLEWLLKQKHAVCSVGMGWGEGSDAADTALDQLMSCPLLYRDPKAPPIDTALVILSVPEDMELEEAHQMLRQIKGAFDKQVKLSTCMCVDDTLAEGVRISALLRAPDAVQEHEESKGEPAAAAPQETHRRKGRGKATKNSLDGQMELPFTEVSLGIFSAKEPTKINGENRDIPTFQRLGLPIDLG